MNQNAALLALALLPTVAQAKCIEQTYAFEGQVLDESGKPAAGARVGVSWREYGQAGGGAIAVADSKGRYRLSVRFRPGDDLSLTGSQCTERLDRISIIAYTGDQRSLPAQLSISRLKQKLPSITINRSAAIPR